MGRKCNRATMSCSFFGGKSTAGQTVNTRPLMASTFEVAPVATSELRHFASSAPTAGHCHSHFSFSFFFSTTGRTKTSPKARRSRTERRGSTSEVEVSSCSVVPAWMARQEGRATPEKEKQRFRSVTRLQKNTSVKTPQLMVLRNLFSKRSEKNSNFDSGRR